MWRMKIDACITRAGRRFRRTLVWPSWRQRRAQGQGQVRTNSGPEAGCPDSSPGHFPFYTLTVYLETWIIISGAKGRGLRFKHFPVTNDFVNTFSKIHNKTKVLTDCSLNSRMEAHLFHLYGGLAPCLSAREAWGMEVITYRVPAPHCVMLAWSQEGPTSWLSPLKVWSLCAHLYFSVFEEKGLVSLRFL